MLLLGLSLTSSVDVAQCFEVPVSAHLVVPKATRRPVTEPVRHMRADVSIHQEAGRHTLSRVCSRRNERAVACVWLLSD